MKPDEDNFRLGYPHLVVTKIRVVVLIVGLILFAILFYLRLTNEINDNIWWIVLFSLAAVFFGIILVISRNEQKSAKKLEEEKLQHLQSFSASN